MVKEMIPDNSTHKTNKTLAGAHGQAMEAAIRKFDFERMFYLNSHSIPYVETKIAKHEGRTDKNLILTETVRPEQTTKVVSRLTGQNVKERIKHGERLHKRVLWQDQVVKAVAREVLRSRVGHRDGSYRRSVGVPVAEKGIAGGDGVSSLLVNGAGPIRGQLEKRVVTELSRILVQKEIDENSTVFIDVEPMGTGLVYQVEKNGGLVNVTTRQKSDVLIQISNANRAKVEIGENSTVFIHVAPTGTRIQISNANRAKV